MPIALDPRETIRFVLKAERELPEAQRTVFLFHPPTLADEREAKSAPDGHEFNLRLLRRCLTGWETFNLRDGSPVPFELTDKGQPKDVTLGRITAADRDELALAIMESGSRISEAERGK